MGSLRQAFIAAGRFRQALLVLALTTTVLNVWAGFDAVSRALPGFDAVSRALPPGWHYVSGPDERVSIWQRVTIIEFGILAVGTVAWLLPITMLKRLRKSVVAAGRFRQALLVLVVTGTILNVWSAIERIPNYTALATDNEKRALSGWESLHQADPQQTIPPDLSSEDAIQESIRKDAADLYNTYGGPEETNAAWERAAKIEFGILAGGLALWLILPAGKARPGAP
jgi:hypothetical protein